jgi:hypothetical protein
LLKRNRHTANNKQQANSKPQTTSRPRRDKLQTVRSPTLDKIRQQYHGNAAAANGHTNHPLQIETLQIAWTEYIQRLKEARNPAAQPFELAQLQIKDENSFEVVTANNIEQKFIEQERNHLFFIFTATIKEPVYCSSMLLSVNRFRKDL